MGLEKLIIMLLMQYDNDLHTHTLAMTYTTYSINSVINAEVCINVGYRIILNRIVVYLLM